MIFWLSAVVLTSSTLLLPTTAFSPSLFLTGLAPLDRRKQRHCVLNSAPDTQQGAAAYYEVGAPPLLGEGDVVEYWCGDDGERVLGLGVVTASGVILPLCRREGNDAGEFFVVYEATPLPLREGEGEARVHRVLSEVFCSQRQIGGGSGPGNPHGEEAEDCYLIEEPLSDGVAVETRPDDHMLP
ncbi:unnamed protein product [Vitrella brassicaformis CCMP3155]|uniref:Sushi domain-containing protein n=1 Tax=Vitrella brassicaformis (strain CCMP3155) TaxID=1169540 RepID=A0A0G4EIA6_VITBC|nr:unnamed protein product [Vitrella brassicaformis CCMP3155]|mmetsp:Transcript_45953/g.114252  ORF Transcript_45953/g.114252 Transcript_45953/m.114252 type:complete len:184 (-) Transcript_45953:364-915(-)|eukprot:CEL95612.1 unnamed protein product [Vitrella brassicaformis CCMP3155]